MRIVAEGSISVVNRGLLDLRFLHVGMRYGRLPIRVASLVSACLLHVVLPVFPRGETGFFMRAFRAPERVDG